MKNVIKVILFTSILITTSELSAASASNPVICASLAPLDKNAEAFKVVYAIFRNNSGNAVTCTAFDAQSNSIAYGCYDGEVTVFGTSGCWSTQSRMPIATYFPKVRDFANLGNITSIAFDQNGNYVITKNENTTIFKLNLTSGETECVTLEEECQKYNNIFAQNSRKTNEQGFKITNFAYPGADFYLLNAELCSSVISLTYNSTWKGDVPIPLEMSKITSTNISPDGKTIVVGTANGFIMLFHYVG